MAWERKKTFYEKFIKVPQDVFLALMGLIILSPLMLVVAILVRIKLGAPVIFKQERAGRNGKPWKTGSTVSDGRSISPERRWRPYRNNMGSTM